MQLFSNANYNFIRWRWHALVLSLVVVLGGIVLLATRGMPLGIEFSGGTQLVLKFNETVSEQQVRDAVARFPGDELVQAYGDRAENQILIRLESTGAEEGRGLEQTSAEIEAAVKGAGLPGFEIRSRELVGPTVGADLQRRGTYAVILSLLAITVYIGIRFRFSFAVGAIAATLHDILVTFAFLTFFGYELSLNIVAAILTITGYSVNDTIVIFDRVRENMKSAMRREGLEHVVNLSVNQTLGRTVITAGTTFVSVFALYLFGGEALEGFAFTMMVGIISGTYSTVFIASSIAIILSQRRKTRSAGAPPVAAQPAAKAKAKNARAS